MTELETLLQPFADRPGYDNLLKQSGFACIALRGLMRHPYMSEDWIAHNSLWASAANEIGRQLNPAPVTATNAHPLIGIGPEAEALLNSLKALVGYKPQPNQTL